MAEMACQMSCSIIDIYNINNIWVILGICMPTWFFSEISRSFQWSVKPSKRSVKRGYFQKRKDIFFKRHFFHQKFKKKNSPSRKTNPIFFINVRVLFMCLRNWLWATESNTSMLNDGRSYKCVYLLEMKISKCL